MRKVCDFLESIKDILNPDIMLDFITSSQNYDKLIFKENSDGSEIKKLNIDHIPKNSIAFTLDYCSNSQHFPQLSQYLNPVNANGINKSCDIVIIVCESDNYDVFLFDLKSRSVKPKKCHLQLNNSEIFLNYLLMLLESYYSDIFKSKKKRKVKKIIGSTNTRLRKNPSRHNADSNEFKDFLEMSINHSNSEGYISFKSF